MGIRVNPRLIFSFSHKTTVLESSGFNRGDRKARRGFRYFLCGLGVLSGKIELGDKSRMKYAQDKRRDTSAGHKSQAGMGSGY